MHSLHASLLLVVTSLVLLAMPLNTAQAGDCPVCTASSECTSSEGAAFCVVHNAPVGCGDMTTLCCPGQGCAVTGGRPSCEGTTCTVIEDVEPDAGTRDAGSSGSDAGSSATDAGTAGADGGASATDGGSSRTDAGTGTGTDEGGCSCRAAAPTAPPTALLSLGAIIALVLVRRRR